MSGFEFARGQHWPWLLLLPVLWALLYFLVGRAHASMRGYGAAPCGPVTRPLWASLRSTLLFALGFLCWLDPRYGDETVAVERAGLDLLFCLDTSRSMLAQDLEPTRLDRALRDVRAVLPHLEGGDRVGLVVFAGAARLWIPLTHDLDSFRGLLDEVDTELVATGGTDLAAALRRCREFADRDQAATTAVLLLTDGEDLAGAGQQAARELRDDGIVVHAVGYGSSMGSKITVGKGGTQEFLRDKDGNEVVTRMDPESLRALASVTGGEFVRADAVALPLVELHQKRLVPMQKRSYEAGEETARKARYQWVLLPLLLLLLWEIANAGGRHR